jgi:hypothetical protein
VVAPERLGEPVGGHRSVALDQQDRQQQAPEAAPDVYRSALGDHGERPEDPKSRCASVYLAHLGSLAPAETTGGWAIAST